MPLEAPTNQTLRPRQSVMGLLNGVSQAMGVKRVG
jgi:hypothetical protein